MDLSAVFGIIFGVIALSVFYLFWKYEHCTNYWRMRGIPQASGLLPIFGNMFPFLTLKYSIFGLSEKLYDENKNYSMVGFFDMHVPALIVRDPDLVKTVMQTEFGNFQINCFPLNVDHDPLLLKNPFFTLGEPWSNSRKRLTFAFSSMRLKIMAHTVSLLCDKFQAYVDKQLDEKKKLEVSAKDFFGRFTAEGVANIGFGLEGKCFEENTDSSSFTEIGNRLFNLTFFKGFMLNLVVCFPLLNKLLGVTFLTEDSNLFFRTAVRNIIKTRRSEETKRKDFFQMMIDFEKMEGEEIDEDSLASHAVSFFLDGFETSRITLSFLSYHLATNQDVYRKLREEVLAVMAKHSNAITYDALKDMTYMDQVINESLRITPSVGAFMKQCSKDTVLRGNDGLSVRVEKGTKILVSATSLHTDPEYWTNPLKFDPERFSPDRKSDIKKFSYLPFGEGPRICVGMRYALLQVKACLAQFVRNYAVELSTKTQVPLRMDPAYFLPYPVGGIWICIKRAVEEF
ncbi:cytochrome P450 6a2-like [Prorops nasuta]|uniref:cytochrome P450 6a2-like n=1 Tax=Prorops nasuta TaxID=863751 RepID=UPI0034CD7AE0